jgi:large subunit ribosomal protein L20
MPRVRKGSARKRAHKRVIREARGYFGTKSRHYQQAKVARTRAGQYAYRDRRNRKRDMRRLWITRITAACRMRGTRYSRFMNGCKNAGILLNRKMLSEMAIHDPAGFDTVVEIAEKAATATPAKG